ncbi:hypothetical protein [Flavobacterium sp. MK4S-17]|uniref:hypothetical protein n=1 Tax=Flavobacterium sp. MK4S-17 TaxID=2543737 RepID=UPI001358759E|nr:hypothetical protein [Flavobacterium sp. MK4S-17]
MRYFFLLAFLFLSSARLWAQYDTKPSGGIAIPRSNTPITPTAPATTPVESPFNLTPEKKNLHLPKIEVGAEKENNSSVLLQTDNFVNRSQEYADRTTIKPRGESNEAFRGNQFFGEHKTNAKYVQILARDFEYVDGDRIKILHNDRIIVPEIILDSDFRGIQITLEPGFNKIDFEALNQGTSGPNTAEFRVYDDKENIVSSNQWNLATGFKATVILVKEVTGE